MMRVSLSVDEITQLTGSCVEQMFPYSSFQSFCLLAIGLSFLGRFQSVGHFRHQLVGMIINTVCAEAFDRLGIGVIQYIAGGVLGVENRLFVSGYSIIEYRGTCKQAIFRIEDFVFQLLHRIFRCNICLFQKSLVLSSQIVVVGTCYPDNLIPILMSDLCSVIGSYMP